MESMWDSSWRCRTEEDLHGFVVHSLTSDIFCHDITIIITWPCANWLFSMSCSENHLQWKFQDIKKNVTTKLNAVHLDASSDCFLLLPERCKKCVAVKENKNFFSLFEMCKFLQHQSWNLIVWPPNLGIPHSLWIPKVHYNINIEDSFCNVMNVQ